RLAEACARAGEITAEPGDGTGRGTSAGQRGRHQAGTKPGARGGNRAGTGGGNRPGTGAGNRAQRPAGTGAATADGNRVPGGGNLLGRARRIAADHRAASGREITVAELALAMGRRKKLAGDLLRQIRAEAPAGPGAGSGSPPSPAGTQPGEGAAL
ncbi:MAG: hypothetical protein J2P26_10805, partial [Nocardiopsaceae bacterium]|nr:hypothetical protein [Nocardiopsaceae bacterium]